MFGGTLYVPKYDDYSEGIKKVLQSQEDRKLLILDDLYGIGVPVASTILHFIYPKVFPIMDVRASEALYYLGNLKAKGRNPKNYVNYRKEILNINQKTNCTIREIDKAFFAYHKKKLQPEFHANEKNKECL